MTYIYICMFTPHRKTLVKRLIYCSHLQTLTTMSYLKTGCLCYLYHVSCLDLSRITLTIDVCLPLHQEMITLTIDVCLPLHQESKHFQQWYQYYAKFLWKHGYTKTLSNLCLNILINLQKFNALGN